MIILTILFANYSVLRYYAQIPRNQAGFFVFPTKETTANDLYATVNIAESDSIYAALRSIDE